MKNTQGKTMDKHPDPQSDFACDSAPDVQLNLNVRGLSPSATVAINELSDNLIGGGRKIYKLGLGQSPFPVPDTVVEELRRNAFQKDYLPVKGLPELRQTIAEHHLRTYGIKCQAEDVLIGPGSKELMFLLQLVYYGDILIPTPAWVSYAPQAQIIGRQIRPLPTQFSGEWKLLPEQLDQLCRSDPGRPRILILNYPANPTGVTYSPEELEGLSEVAKEYRVILLSDEIYGKLHHENKHTSVVSFYPEGTIFSGGLSKWCGAGGWRLGVFVFPECLRWLLNAMAAVASETFTSTSAPIQYAAIRAFQESESINIYLDCARKILGSLGKTLASMLKETGIEVLDPQGGFYLFPRFNAFSETLKKKGIRTSVELCARLLEDTGVAMLPGKDFGRPPEELTARIAYVNFNGEKALDAVKQKPKNQHIDKQFLYNYCSETLTAVECICDWITS